MAKKKKEEKPKGGRPENWQEICMERVPSKKAEPLMPEEITEEVVPEKAVKKKKTDKKEG